MRYISASSEHRLIKNQPLEIGVKKKKLSILLETLHVLVFGEGRLKNHHNPNNGNPSNMD